MGNREVNYPDILPQEQPPTHLSLSCNSHVKTDVNSYNNTTRNNINSRKVIQAHKHLWDGKSPSDQYILMVPESKILKCHLMANFQIKIRNEIL